MIRPEMIKLIKEQTPIFTRPAKVLKVDGDTCTVFLFDDDSELNNVRLTAKTGGAFNYKIVPKVDSHVLVTLIMNDEISAFVSLIDDPKEIGFNVDETAFKLDKNGIEINGGDFGGLVKVAELETKLNALVSKFNAHTHTVATTGTAAAQSGTAAVTTQTAQIFNKSDFENTKVTH